MNMKTILYSISFCLLFVLTSLGQNTGIITNPDIKYFTLNDGLSQVSINDICKDRKGFLWLGTQNGLNRYDGSSFKVYKSDANKHGTVSGNYINVVFEDSRGYLWVGTENEGLCYLDPNTGLFVVPELSVDETRITVNAISEDPYGRIFIAFDKLGIGTFTFMGDAEGQFNLWNNSDSLQVSTLYISEDSVLWVGSREGKLYKSFLAENAPCNFKVCMLEDKNFISSIKSTLNHQIFIGTRSGLFLYNDALSEIEPVQFDSDSRSNNFTDLLIYDIVFESLNRCWIATGDGLYETEINTENNTIRILNIYKANQSDTHLLSNNTVFCIEPDPINRLLWIGTGKYLNLLIQDKPFYTLQSISGDEQSLSSGVVFSVLKQDEKLWIGTSDGGLNMIENDRFFHYNEAQLGLPNNPIFSLAEDRFNNLWVGTKSGITVISSDNINRENIKFTTLTHAIEDSESLSDNFTRNICVDSKDNVWICTQLGGLNRFTGDIKKGKFAFQKFKHNPEAENAISSDKIYCMIEDRSGNYWLGTDAGLNKLSFKFNDYSKPVFTKWSYHPDSSDCISNNTVYSIAEDRKGMIWIGTRDGLNRFDPFNGTFKVFNSESGLPDNVIYSVLEDKSGEIWVSTNNGLSRLDQNNMEFVNYNVGDGLLAREFNLNAHFMDEKGMLYFGCINGLNMFFPDSLKNIDKTQQIIFTDIKYNAATNGDKSKFVSAEIADVIKLNYQNFPLSIRFTDVDIRPYKDVSFAYRLLPNNNAWNHIGVDRSIQFPRLAPGKYEIQIQGITREKIWNSKPLIVKLLVTPPIWGSVWAFVFYFILLLSVLYFIYLKRLQSILSMRETRRLKELSAFKNKFFTDITHEFRTPLTVIMGLTRNVKLRIDGSDQRNIKNLNTIERNGEVLLHLVNQMLDLARLDRAGLELKPVQSDVIPYLQYVFECFDSAAKIKGLKIWFYKECTSVLMDYDAEHLYKVISNLLSNAILHTPENGKILMHVNRNSERSELIVKVHNSGNGIPEQDLERIFERFYTSSSADSNSGMGVGLSLSRELAKVMGGDISARNIQGEGVEFTVILPITNQAPLSSEKKKPRIVVPHITSESLSKKDTDSLDENKLLVLVIEDNRDVSDYIKLCLTNKYNVHCCYDGSSGVEEALSLIPDMIISDIMMPGISGIEVCSSLKSDRRTCHIPIILLTALSEDSDKIKGLTAGADAYLKKPFDETELMVRIEKLIELRQIIQKKYHSFSEIANHKSLDDDFISEVIKLIRNHISDLRFKTSDLAFTLHLSESQLYRKIKALSGRSTALFIRYIRLEEAKKLLVNTNMNISEIAYACGFSDPAWFSRSFKEEYGYSPSEFREKGKNLDTMS